MVVVIININYCAQTELRTVGGEQLFLSETVIFHLFVSYSFDQPEVDSGLVVVESLTEFTILFAFELFYNFGLSCFPILFDCLRIFCLV